MEGFQVAYQATLYKVKTHQVLEQVDEEDQRMSFMNSLLSVYKRLRQFFVNLQNMQQNMKQSQSDMYDKKEGGLLAGRQRDER